MLEQRLQSSKEAEKSINDSMVRKFQHYLCTFGGGGREGGREGTVQYPFSSLLTRIISHLWPEKNIF